MQVNLTKLNKYLYYHPAWAKDKKLMTSLMHQSSFTDSDILVFARLYVKYSHLHCFEVNELTNYFNYILQRMELYTPESLFKKTNKIYKQFN